MSLLNPDGAATYQSPLGFSAPYLENSGFAFLDMAYMSNRPDQSFIGPINGHWGYVVGFSPLLKVNHNEPMIESDVKAIHTKEELHYGKVGWWSGKYHYYWRFTVQKPSTLDNTIRNADFFGNYSPGGGYHEDVDQRSVRRWMSTATTYMQTDSDGNNPQDVAVNATISLYDPWFSWAIQNYWPYSTINLGNVSQLKNRTKSIKEDIMILGEILNYDANGIRKHHSIFGATSNTVHSPGAFTHLTYPLKPDEHTRKIVLFVGDFRYWGISMDFSIEETLLHEVGHYAGMTGHPTGTAAYKHRIMNQTGYDSQLPNPNPNYTTAREFLSDQEKDYYLGEWKFPSTKVKDGYKPRPFPYKAP